MPELREEILGAGINKKKVITVVLVSVILVAFFGYSVFFISFIFGSQRTNPSKNYDDYDYEEVEKVMPPLPLDILLALAELLLANPDLLADLISEEDFSDVISEMIDGDIDNLDIGDFSQALLPILGAAGAYLIGEQEIFRIYNNSDINGNIDANKLSDALWKYESFDEYNEFEWLSNAATEVTDFTPLSDFFSKYSTLDIIKIKIALPEHSAGQNAMVIPSLFPFPYIMEDSFSAPTLVPGSPILNKDEFNCSIINLDFSTEDEVNLTYNLFGEELPSDQDINSSVIYVTNASTEYENLLTQFTQLPPSVNEYINSHPFFKSHYDALANIIDDSDNVYIKSKKIKSYLQTNFVFSYDAVMNDPPADDEDVVEWFSEHEEGLYTEFASAFCVFARAFGVPNRFVDGYRTKSKNLLTQNYEIDEITDSQEGKDAITIKYKHLYNWAEIYIPTDITGNGYWIQFDIEPESASTGSFTLNLNSNFTAGYRGQDANLIAVLSSPESSVTNRTITFTDITSGLPGTEIDRVLTDQNGQASVIVNISNSQVVGLHLIIASFQTLANDTTTYNVYGDIDINLESVNPTEVNRSISNSTIIQGYVNDPIANQRVEGATVEFILLELGTNNKIANPFDITNNNSDSNGYFNTTVIVDPSVIPENYEIRVDFNGSWAGVPLALGYMSNSSERIEFNVTEDNSYTVLFSINGTPTKYPNDPDPAINLINVKRGEQLNFSVTVLDDVSGAPVSGENVGFYDYTNGNVLIGSKITNSKGIAWMTYNIGTSNKSGPTLVYTKVSMSKNYSYYIVNESIGIDIVSFSNPPEIDVKDGAPYPTFNIQCELIDDFDNPINFSQIDLKMNNSIGDTTSNLTTPLSVNPTSLGSNSFDFDRSVKDGTPVGNYTIKLEFNGAFNFSSYLYNATFNIAYIYNSSEIPKQLRVFDSNDVQVNVFINGTPARETYDNLNKPIIFNPGEDINFTVDVDYQGGDPAPTDFVRIFDVYYDPEHPYYEDTFVDGKFEFIIPYENYIAGIHKIRVQFMDFINKVNTTFIVINEVVNITVDSLSPSDTIIRDDNINLVVTGKVQNGSYLVGLRGLNVSLQLFNSSGNNVSQYLIGSRFDVTDSNGEFRFVISSVNILCPQGNYNLRIDFNGSIFLDEIPGIGPISFNMINTSSSLIALDINASTDIIPDGYHSLLESDAPTEWINWDTLYVYGNLTWDNGTEMTAIFINVTILYVGNVIAFNDIVQTDLFGGFNVSLVVDENWPQFRIDTEIFVKFDSIYNGFSYVEDCIVEFV